LNHEKEQSPGAVVVAAIIGETSILLIKEVTKPTPHYWKLVSETVENGEPILDALQRGVAEEAVLKLEVRLANGQVVEIIDKRINVARQLVPSHMLWKPTTHRRHFWGLMTTDEVVQSLSGQKLTGDKNEEIETKAFPLAELGKMAEFREFLPHHDKLINMIGKVGAGEA